MSKLLRRYRQEIVIFLVISILYFILRIPNLTLQPIFADEAIYIRWAQVMRAEPTLRFLPLSDGKTPLFMWAMIPFLKIFDDPLLAGRFLSVLSGFLTLLGVLFLGGRFFNTKVGLWSAFLVATVPFMVFFDRMALVDSMLAAFSIWSLNIALFLLQFPRIDLAMVLGYVLGAGWLTKTPGFFNIITIPSTLLIFNWGVQDRQSRLLKILGLWMIAFAITFTMYNLLRLGPGFSNLSSRNQDYVFSLLDLTGRPLDPFIPHMKDLADWFPKLLTLPILAFFISGIFLTFFQKNRLVYVILLWGLIPLIIESFFLKTFTARYILFSIPPLLIITAWAVSLILDKIKTQKRVAKFITIMIVLGFSGHNNFYLLTNLEKANLPRSERLGYLEDWTAGYGLKEIANFLIKEAEKESIVVGTEGSFGTLPDGLQIYLDKHFHTASSKNQISIIGGDALISEQLRQAALEHPTFFVANKSRFYSFDNLQILLEYPKVEGPRMPQDSMILYRVFPLSDKKTP